MRSVRALLVIAAACTTPSRTPSAPPSTVPPPATTATPAPPRPAADPDPTLQDAHNAPPVDTLANGVRLRVWGDYHSGRPSGERISIVIAGGTLDEKDDERGVASWVARLAAANTHLGAGVRTRVRVSPEETQIDLTGDSLFLLADAVPELLAGTLDDATIEMSRKGEAMYATLRPSDEDLAAMSGTRLAQHVEQGDEGDVKALPVARVRAFRDRLWIAPRISVLITSSERGDKAIAAVREAFDKLPKADPGSLVDTAAAMARTGPRSTTITYPTDVSSSIEYLFLVPRRPIVRASDLRARLAEKIAIDGVIAHARASVHGWRFTHVETDVDPLSTHVDVVRIKFYADNATLAWLARVSAPAFAEITRGFAAAESQQWISEAVLGWDREIAPKEERSPTSSMGISTIGYGGSSWVIGRDLAYGDQIARQRTLDELRAHYGHEVTAADVAAFAPYFARDRAAIVARVAKGEQMTPAALRAVFDGAKPRDATPDSAFLDPAPVAGTITSERLDANGTTWTLSNGATVVIAPDGPPNHDLVLEAWSPGGALAMPDGQIDAAFAIPDVAAVLGVGRLDASGRETVRQAHSTKVQLLVEANRHGVYGEARDAAEVPRLLEETHALLAAPIRDDDAANAALRERLKQGDYHETLKVSPRLAAQLDALPVSPHKPAEVWDAMRARFGHAKGFTFVLRNIDPGQAKKHVLTYLASLPEGTADKAQKVEVPSSRLEMTKRGRECGIALRWVGVPKGKTATDGLDDLLLLQIALTDYSDGIGATTEWIDAAGADRAFRVQAARDWSCSERGKPPWGERQLRAKLARYARGDFADDELPYFRSEAGRLSREGDYTQITEARVSEAIKRLMPGDNLIVVHRIGTADERN